MMEGDEIALLLQNIPCSFNLSATVATKTKSSLGVIIEKLLKEDQMCVYDTEEEVLRDYNLLSYLFWCTGNANNAFEFNNKALERSDKNITAAVNKIWFYLEVHSPYEAKTALDYFLTRKQNKHFECILLTGEAEIAYAYTRLGFSYYERAVKAFNEVLSKADQQPDMDKNSVYLWKAGLGLTLRRLSLIGNVRTPLEMQRTKQRLRDAVEVFVELVESDWDSERNKAFSYVQLAQVAANVELENLPPNEYFPVKYRGWDIEAFYHMAEKHCKGDTYTLERYGNFLRQKNKLDEAEQKLRASTAFMPTSTAHHYLALVLKAKLNNDLKKSKHRPFGKSSTRPWTGEYQQYPKHDFRKPRFGFSATKNTRTRSPLHGQQMGRRDQKQQYTRRQQLYNHSGLKERDPASSGGYKDCWDQGNQNYALDTTWPNRETSNKKQEQKMEDSSPDFMRKEANTAVMRSKVKCPKTMLPYPKEDARVSEILYHLDQAMELGDNGAATYDKGLILRAAQDFDEAISTFRSLIKEKTSLMYLANAYEQCALCFQSKLEDVTIDLETKQKLSHDRKSYLMSSVAFSTKMVTQLPNITGIWDAGASLKNILMAEGKSKETLKELAILSERLRDYKDDIGYYQELLLLDEYEQENPAVLLGIIRNLIADGKFIEAVSVFDLIMMTPRGKKCIDEKLYCTALIEAGFEGVREKVESNSGSGHLKAVLNHSSGWCVTEGEPKDDRGNAESQSCQSPAETDEETFDIFILCSENDEGTLRNAKQMVGFLQARCNVTATLNRDDVVPGRLELSTMLTFISQSQSVVVCLDEPAFLQGILQRGIEHAAREKPNIVVILMNARARIPNCLMGFPSILYETRDEVSEIEWMKSLFYKIARC